MISWICAKPIIDIAVAVKSFQDFMKHDEELKENGIIYRKQDVPGQHLYRSGNLDNDIVTHYIHIVISDSETWNNYINFRDHLNNNKEEALRYEKLKFVTSLIIRSGRNKNERGTDDEDIIVPGFDLSCSVSEPSEIDIFSICPLTNVCEKTYT